MRDNAAELDYDLMTMTGRTLDEYADMGPAGTVALVHFVRCLGPESRLWRAMHEDDGTAAWHTAAQSNAILADIYDELAAMRREQAVKGTGKRPKRAKPYPRPGKSDARKVGREPIRVRDFERWWKEG
jgi:hypothetical protein